MKNEAIDMKPVIDLTGATTKVLKNMVAYFEQAKEEAKDKMIQPNKYWAYLTKNIKAEAKLTNEMLLGAGMSVPLVMECLEEADAPAALPYKNLYLTMADKSTKKVPLKDALDKIAPFSKQFKTPVEALMMGDPDAILKVMQHAFGKDVSAWSVPAEKESWMPKLAAAVLVELFSVAKYAEKANSMLFKTVEGKIVEKKDVVKAIVDAFEKKDRAFLVKMFPNTFPEYPEALLQESQTVLNTLSKELMDKLFPNINKEYLVNLKESELKELVKKLSEGISELEEAPKRKYQHEPDPDGGPMSDDEEEMEEEGAVEQVETFVQGELETYLLELKDRAMDYTLDQVTSDTDKAKEIVDHAMKEITAVLQPVLFGALEKVDVTNDVRKELGLAPGESVKK